MRGEQDKSCSDRKDNATIGFKLKTDLSVMGQTTTLYLQPLFGKGYM